MDRSDELITSHLREKGSYLVSYKNPPLWIFARGYLDAAEALAAVCEERGLSAGDDKYLYPLIYLLRHSIELFLKDYSNMLWEHLESNDLLSEKTKRMAEKAFKSHSLLQISHLIETLASNSPVHRKIDFKELRSRLEVWHKIDNFSDTFRYHKSVRGKVHKVFEKQWYADIWKLVRSAKDVCDYIEYAGSDERVVLYDQRLTSHAHLQLIERGKSLLQKLIDTFPPETKSAPIKPKLRNASDMLKEYEADSAKSAKELHGFRLLLGQFSDEELAVALYSYYVSNYGLDWSILRMRTSSRDELTQRLNEKAHAIVGSAGLIDREINLLRKVLTDIDNFYPSHY